MTTKSRWNFQVKWLGDSNVIVAHKIKDTEEWSELALTIKEYSDFMQLLQEFNMHFRDKIDQKLVEAYFNE